MRFAIYSHCGGSDHVQATAINDIAQSIESVSLKINKGAATKLRNALLQRLLAAGWSKEILVSRESEITITSMKGKVGLCLQTGNMARVYADLLKLQTLYIDKAISSSILVVPSQPIARKLGSNVANATRLERELRIFDRVITVPLLVFALE